LAADDDNHARVATGETQSANRWKKRLKAAATLNGNPEIAISIRTRAAGLPSDCGLPAS